MQTSADNGDGFVWNLTTARVFFGTFWSHANSTPSGTAPKTDDDCRRLFHREATLIWLLKLFRLLNIIVIVGAVYCPSSSSSSRLREMSGMELKKNNYPITVIIHFNFLFYHLLRFWILLLVLLVFCYLGPLTIIHPRRGQWLWAVVVELRWYYHWYYE